MQKYQGQWTPEQAWEWYNTQPWIRGFNGYPSNCVNRIAMWQKYNHEEVAKQIDYEFGLAEELGFNAVRCFIQFEPWYYEHDSFMANLEEYFTMADAHGIRVMLVLGNDCTVAKSRFKPAVFGEQKIDWGYHSGIKGGQHAGDYTEAGYQLLDDPEIGPKYFDMVDEFAKKYGQDDRLQIWDIWNEYGNSHRGKMSLPALLQFADILRSNRVKQPITAGPLNTPELRDPCHELSDIISFHYYGPNEGVIPMIEELRERWERPLLNTEWLNRIGRNTVDYQFPLYYLERIGSYNWGLIQGYSQTFEPWGGYYIRQSKGEELDLTLWQHDLYRFNGLPYIPAETKLIRRFCDLADARDRKAGIIK